MAAPSDTLFVSGLPAGIPQDQVKSIFSAYGDINTVTVVGQSAYIKFATADEAKWIQENLNGNMPEGLTEPIEVKFHSGAKGKGKAGKDDWSKGGKGDWGYGKAGKDGKGEKGDSWGPYGKGGKDFGGEDSKGKDGKGKGKGKGKISIRDLFDGLCKAGALPGGEKYENDENTIFVGSLPTDTTSLDLYKIFSPFGAIAPKGILAMLHRDTGNCKGYGFVNFLDGVAAQTAIAALNGTTMGEGEEQTQLTVTNKRLGGDSGEGKGDGKSFGKGESKGKWGKGKW